MITETYSFSSASTTYYFDASFAQLKKTVDIKSAIIITDENVFKAHTEKFKNIFCPWSKKKLLIYRCLIFIGFKIFR